jgi:hypothetical protein
MRFYRLRQALQTVVRNCGFLRQIAVAGSTDPVITGLPASALRRPAEHRGRCRAPSPGMSLLGPPQARQTAIQGGVTLGRLKASAWPAGEARAEQLSHPAHQEGCFVRNRAAKLVITIGRGRRGMEYQRKDAPEVQGV